MSLPLRCPGCGSANVEEDDLYAQRQLVCVDCGSVVSEGALTCETVGPGTSGVSYSRTTAETKKLCLNLKKGVQRVKAICRTLRVNSEIEDLSETYFKQSYQHESFLRVSLQKKEVLGGCCVLVSCRLLNWPLTMGTISCLLDADPAVVGAVYQEMVKILNIEAPIINITDVMEAHTQEYKISPLEVPEEFAESSAELTKRALALVELAADSWIVTGRRPVPIMMAAIFLAWQSLKPTKRRLKFTLDKFCQLAKVNKAKPAMKRITEMKEVLCKLGKEIPWVLEAVTPNNVLQLAADILKHRNVLLLKAMRSHEDALLQDAGCQDTPTSQESPGAAGEEETNTDDEEAHRDAAKNEDSEPNWGKRELFAPPCVTQAKRRRVQPEQLKDVTGDEEISDSEIDSYIRTPREARDFALMQTTFEAS